MNGRRNRSRMAFARSVFINCPFDRKYLTTLRPVLFTVIALGFKPRIATERSDSAESRVAKICELIRESRFSIHDLSRLKPGGRAFARMNMPFELGIDYGARQFGQSRLRDKKFLILGAMKYDYQRAVSDLSGVDIKSHDGVPKQAVRALRDWFYETCGVRPAPSWKELWYSFNDFSSALYSAGKASRMSPADLDRMPSAEFIDHVEQWLRARTRTPHRADGAASKRGSRSRSGS